MTLGNSSQVQAINQILQQNQNVALLEYSLRIGITPPNSLFDAVGMTPQDPIGPQSAIPRTNEATPQM